MPEQQLPLFPFQPATPEEISRQTPLQATLPHFREYLLREGKSENTVKAFIGDMKLLAEHTGAGTPVGHYTTTRLNDFLRWMENGRGVPCSRKTYARRVTTLKVYFKWLKNLGAIPHDPARAVLQRSGPAPLSSVLSVEQVQAAVDAARGMTRNNEHDYRPELLFRLLLDTGIKKSEAARLTPTDFDRSNPQMPTMTIRHKLRNIYKERRIVVKPDFMDLLDHYLVQYKPGKTLFTCTTRNLEYILTEVGERAGIPFKLSFEVMRWTCAVRDTRAGLEEDLIREKLGLSRTSWYETGAKIRRLVEQQIEEEQVT